jgi:hypothetical protein
MKMGNKNNENMKTTDRSVGSSSSNYKYLLYKIENLKIKKLTNWIMRVYACLTYRAPRALWLNALFNTVEAEKGVPTREKNSRCHFIQTQLAFKAIPNLSIFANIMYAKLAAGRRGSSGGSSGCTLDLEQFLKIFCSPRVEGLLKFFKVRFLLGT